MNLINPQTGKPYYYKDNPQAVKKRDARRMYVDGKEVSKKHPLHKAGKYTSFEDAAFSSLGTYATKKEGHVYVISNPAWDGWYKVGKAVDAKDRYNSYNTSSPFRDFKLEYYVKVSDRGRAEKTAHSLLLKECKNHSGEWFNISFYKIKKILSSLDCILEEEKKKESENEQLELKL